MILIMVGAWLLSSCKKSGSSGNDNPGTPLSYKYHGTMYDGSDGNWGIINAGTTVVGVTINRPDLFGGTIAFKSPDCAYLSPASREVTEHAGCILTYADGTAIDSSEVYLYKSGVFISTTSNCKQKKVTDIFTGETTTVEECDVKANFSLVLVNNKGDSIEIEDGIINARFQF